ncbi:MAG: tryptophan synthase subunit alpha [Rhodospirillales bacterium]
MSRIGARFDALKKEGRGGLITFTTAGDPDLETSYQIFKGLPVAGADLIELGMPFTDPMADGPAIQASGQRALKTGITMDATFGLVRRFRDETGDDKTPILLMGYYNLIYARGAEAFCKAAAAAGVDGLIVVDLPPEEADELKPYASAVDIDTVLLTAPTTDAKRLPAILEYASGFLYYVSILGVTGTRSATEDAVRDAVKRLKQQTPLPVAVGFGIRTPDQAAAVARVADAAVVGSAIVDKVRANLDGNGKAKPNLVGEVHGLVRDLAKGVRNARK